MREFYLLVGWPGAERNTQEISIRIEDDQVLRVTTLAGKSSMEMDRTFQYLESD
jgi:hypothetical protein